MQQFCVIIELLTKKHSQRNFSAKNLMITEENFEMQMKFLGENFDVIPINELEGHLSSKSDEFKVIITFDDGYIDNKLNAIQFWKNIIYQLLFIL